MIGFKDEETHVTVQESSEEAHVMISRFKGSSGTITVDYETQDISAVGGGTDDDVDYVKSKGNVTFKPEEMSNR